MFSIKPCEQGSATEREPLLGTYIEEFEFLSWGTSQIDDLPAGNVFGEGVPETLRRYNQMLGCWSFA